MRTFMPLFVLAGVMTMGLGPTCEPPPTPAANLPLLPPGTNYGTTRYGAATLPALGSAERALLDNAVRRGLSGFTYYVDWADLEASRGRYTLDTFTETLGGLQQLGVQPFVNITVGDIEAYNVPAPFADGAGGLTLPLDDPEVISRFGMLLDQVVPIVAAHGGFYLGLGNEIDARTDNVFSDELDAYVHFVAAARDRVRRLAPDLAVGVTLTGAAVRHQTPTFTAMRAVCDVVPFNWGPIEPDFHVTPLNRVREEFRTALAAYGDAPIVIQELTCPSAAEMGADVAWQQRAFALLFEEIRATENVRFVSVFTFQDFDAATCAIVQAALIGDELDDLPPDVAKRLSAYFCELGLVDERGTAKPAWQVFLNELGPADGRTTGMERAARCESA